MKEEDGTPNTQAEAQGEKKVSPREAARHNLSEAERITVLRERLYARGKAPEMRERHSLEEKAPAMIHEVVEKPVPSHIPRSTPSSPGFAQRGQSTHGPQGAVLTQTPQRGVPPGDTPTTLAAIDTMIQKKRSRSYRIKLALAGIIFFVGSLIVSSLFLFTGNNTISGENISLDVSGPIAIGGGEVMSFQIAIANQNTVPMETATLIIDYPRGIQSASEPGKEIFTDRQQLNNIGTGEVVNVPMKVIAFGEENEEKEIKARVEYRVQGSNATFSKEAAPLKFRISSSPVVLTVDTVKSISSGQEAEIVLTVQSNSPTELTDLLVKASYPYGFDFSRSDPDTVSGQDTWKISSLKPEEKKKITIRGIVVGKEDEVRRFTFDVGVPNERDAFNLASVLMNTATEIAIEQPFLDVGVTINSDTGETVVIDAEQTASVRISFKNALEDMIYDGVIRVELSGNALNEVDVRANNGFYDSTKNTITWDSVDVSSLKEIAPGQQSEVSFTITPRADVGKTPEVQLRVAVQGQRVFEDRVPQQLVGTIDRTIKIESVPKLASSALYSEGPFTNTGPIPPIAEKMTQYTLLLSVDNGTNDVTGAEVTAILPQYIQWLDLVSDNDQVTYTATTRTLKWTIGNMSSQAHEEAWMQVSFVPSLTQIDSTPTILEAQRFKATDRFTGTVVRTDAPALTSALFNDPDPSLRDGRVRKE